MFFSIDYRYWNFECGKTMMPILRFKYKILDKVIDITISQLREHKLIIILLQPVIN